MFVYFHSKGTAHYCSDIIHIDVCTCGILICNIVSTVFYGGIQSTPNHLFSFVTLILLATKSAVTIIINCHNFSVLCQWNYVSCIGHERDFSHANIELMGLLNSSLI